MENSKKIKDVDYEGYSTDIISYKNKKKLFIKTQRNDEGNSFIATVEPILNEYVGFAILKDMATVFKGIKTPQATKISYEVDDEIIAYKLEGSKYSGDELTAILNEHIKMEFITSSFKVKGKTLDKGSRKMKFIEILNMLANYAFPNILIGNHDAHSKNYIVKLSKKAIKQYYIIDLGNAFQDAYVQSLDGLKHNLFYGTDPKLKTQDEKDFYNNNYLDELFDENNPYLQQLIKRFQKQSEYINSKDFSSIIDRQVNLFIQMYKKAFIEFLKAVDIVDSLDNPTKVQEFLKQELEDRIKSLKEMKKEYKNIIIDNKKVLKKIMDFFNKNLEGNK